MAAKGYIASELRRLQSNTKRMMFAEEESLTAVWNGTFFKEIAGQRYGYAAHDKTCRETNRRPV